MSDFTDIQSSCFNISVSGLTLEWYCIFCVVLYILCISIRRHKGALVLRYKTLVGLTNISSWPWNENTLLRDGKCEVLQLASECWRTVRVHVRACVYEYALEDSAILVWSLVVGTELTPEWTCHCRHIAFSAPVITLHPNTLNVVYVSVCECVFVRERAKQREECSVCALPECKCLRV